MNVNWKHVAACAVCMGAGYGGGLLDGRAPAGSPRPSTAILGDITGAGVGAVHVGSEGGQQIVGEVGSVAATAGNGLEGAGGAVQDSTAAPAAPK